jgi:hypothetical protein
VESCVFFFADMYLHGFDDCGQRRFANASKKDKSGFQKAPVDNPPVVPELSPELCFDSGGLRQ